MAPRMRRNEGHNILALRRGSRLPGHSGSFPAPGEPRFRPFPEASESGPGKGRVRTIRGSDTGQRTAGVAQVPTGSESRPGSRDEGGEQLSDVNVNLKVFSENTALSDSRYYRQTVQKI